MDREYLEDYEAKEEEEVARFNKDVLGGKFGTTDMFPRRNRFLKLQNPVAHCGGVQANRFENICAQIPFTGSLILCLPPIPRANFEQMMFRVDEIPEIIAFIKETGKLQVTLSADPTAYIGLDFLDDFFKELSPPFFVAGPLTLYCSELEEKKARESFRSLAEINCTREFGAFYFKQYPGISTLALQNSLQKLEGNYAYLKVRGYKLASTIEDLLVDDPWAAMDLLYASGHSLSEPALNFCSEVTNYSLQDIQANHALPESYPRLCPKFPSEIGKFLFEKLTYAPQTIRGCYELLDTYGDYELQKIQRSLNEAILNNRPDVVSLKADDLSKTLDNIWDDKTIERRIKSLKVGVPLSVAVVGDLAAALESAGHPLEGFLTGLGFNVLSAIVENRADSIFEKAAKKRAKSYQIDVFDFNKAHASQIPKKNNKEV